MHTDDWLAERFNEHRPRLQAIAHRMLGSDSDADDAVQEAWMRLTRHGGDAVDNLGGWLTTVVSRVAVDMLRSRRGRQQDLMGDDPGGEHVIDLRGEADPEAEAVLADSVGAALLIVLDTLAPTERLAFVLHDTFAVPFADIGGILGRSPAAAKQLAHRARTKVRGGADPVGDLDPRRQRTVVEAFLAASREGDLRGLIALLDPTVVMDADDRAVRMGAAATVTGPEKVATVFAGRALAAQPAAIDGAVGIVWPVDGRPKVVWDIIITDGRVTHIDMLADSSTIDRLEITPL